MSTTSNSEHRVTRASKQAHSYASMAGGTQHAIQEDLAATGNEKLEIKVLSVMQASLGKAMEEFGQVSKLLTVL